LFNAHHDVVQFTLPAPPRASEWIRTIDTNLDDDAESRFQTGDRYDVTGRSLLLFMESNAK
jgi:isoamylase